MRISTLMLTALSVGVVPFVLSAGSAQATTPSVVPGSLLHSTHDATEPLMIRTQQVPDRDPVSPGVTGGMASQADFNTNNPPGEAEFHIINGPDKSEFFIGHHYSGSILWSSYQEQPWGRPHKNIWHHYEWGPNESLYWKQSH